MRQFIFFDNVGILINTELWYFQAKLSKVYRLGIITSLRRIYFELIPSDSLHNLKGLLTY
jgi:hypothetical protein